MTTLATAHVISPAAPEAFFERWADMATWPEWNGDTEWVRLDGPFTAGSTGRLKPRGGPSVAFVIERLVPGQEFVDVSTLFGARLTFDHQVSRTPDGNTRVDVTATLTGPLRPLWQAILGKGIAATLQSDADALARAAESTDRAA